MKFNSSNKQILFAGDNPGCPTSWKGVARRLLTASCLYTWSTGKCPMLTVPSRHRPYPSVSFRHGGRGSSSGLYKHDVISGTTNDVYVTYAPAIGKCLMAYSLLKVNVLRVRPDGFDMAELLLIY